MSIVENQGQTQHHLICLPYFGPYLGGLEVWELGGLEVFGKWSDLEVYREMAGLEGFWGNGRAWRFLGRWPGLGVRAFRYRARIWQI